MDSNGIDWGWVLSLLGVLFLVVLVVCISAVIISATIKTIKEKK